MQSVFQAYHRQFEWGLGVVVVVTALAAWLCARGIDEGITIYDVYPPLGLIAFGLMWTHFVMGALRRYFKVVGRSDTYRTISFGLVLGMIVLHPTLLWIGLYQDGLGLPPKSHIVAYESQLLAVVLGSIGLTIFLAYELHRWFSDRKWWRYIELAQIFGMAAIFYHAIELGGELRLDWYMALWWFYGVSLAAAIIYSELIAKRHKEV